MDQKLILPINNARVTAGYKRPAYKSYWGYDHYGIDYSASGSAVLASGNGTVATAAYDNAVGYTVCIIYPDAYNHSTGKSYDLVARYMHLASLSVKAGESVTAGKKIGVEGNTGSGKWGVHLHVEFDTDTKYPNYSPQVAGSNLIKKGTDSTVNPSHIFHIGAGQTLKAGYLSGYAGAEDVSLPNVDSRSNSSNNSEQLAKELELLKAHNEDLQLENELIKEDIKKLYNKFV